MAAATALAFNLVESGTIYRFAYVLQSMCVCVCVSQFAYTFLHNHQWFSFFTGNWLRNKFPMQKRADTQGQPDNRRKSNEGKKSSKSSKWEEFIVKITISMRINSAKKESNHIKIDGCRVLFCFSLPRILTAVVLNIIIADHSHSTLSIYLCLIAFRNMISWCDKSISANRK